MNILLAEILLPVAVLGTLALGLIFFTKTLTGYLLRKKMVEKGITGVDASELLKFQSENENKLISLKWGLIILFGGLGLIILEAVPFDATSPLPYGVFAASLSLGFLIYYAAVKRLEQK